MSLFNTIKNFQWQSLLRTANVEKLTIVLTRRHVYILPSRFGLMFAFVVLLMLIGSINYALNLGFVMTFLLAGLGNVVMLHSWKNLLRLELQPIEIENAHAGSHVTVGMRLYNNTSTPKIGIGLQIEGAEEITFVDVLPQQSADVIVTLSTRNRGKFTLPRIKIHTTYPLSLFYVWSYANLHTDYFVYPQPKNPGFFPEDTQEANTSESMLSVAKRGDEFDGHRPYRRGDSPRQIDWKASSKQTEWMVKETTSYANHERMLRWQDTRSASNEDKLSELCFWLLEMQAQQINYGLEIPGLKILPSSGQAHLNTCLIALANFN